MAQPRPGFRVQSSYAADRAFGEVSRASICCNTTKSDGTTATVSSVEPIIPVSVAKPIDFCALAPAPLARTSGTSPENECERGHCVSAWS